MGNPEPFAVDLAILLGQRIGGDARVEAVGAEVGLRKLPHAKDRVDAVCRRTRQSVGPQANLDFVGNPAEFGLKFFRRFRAAPGLVAQGQLMGLINQV